MPLNDLVDQVQAQAESLIFFRTRTPLKFTKDPLTLRFRDPRTLVCHLQHKTVCLFL